MIILEQQKVYWLISQRLDELLTVTWGISEEVHDQQKKKDKRILAVFYYNYSLVLSSD